MISAAIASLRASGGGVVPWAEFAVLVRAGFVAKPIVDALGRAVIPARRVAVGAPEVAAEVQAAVAWLRLAASRRDEVAGEHWDPGADDAFRRACALPRRGTASQFRRLRDAAVDSRLALADAIRLAEMRPEDRRGFEEVLDIARRIAAALSGLAADSALRLAADMSGTAALISSAGPKARQEFETVCAGAAQAGSVAAFVDMAALDAAEAAGPTSDGVQVMTLHAAKGLEFDHVFLAGLEDGLFPSRRAEHQGALAEERRLFYVGPTRARKTLHLTWAQSRQYQSRASRFLSEIKPLPSTVSPPARRWTSYPLSSAR